MSEREREKEVLEPGRTFIANGGEEKVCLTHRNTHTSQGQREKEDFERRK